jgi:hypothetical protein
MQYSVCNSLWQMQVVSFLYIIIPCQARLHNCEKPLLASSCLSVRMKQLSSHWTDFHEIMFVNFLRKSVEMVQVSLKYDKNKGYFNPLAQGLDIYSLAHHLCKMWIFYESSGVTLRNTRHFVEE